MARQMLRSYVRDAILDVPLLVLKAFDRLSDQHFIRHVLLSFPMG
jgi:hypothetical protein